MDLYKINLFGGTNCLETQSSTSEIRDKGRTESDGMQRATHLAWQRGLATYHLINLQIRIFEFLQSIGSVIVGSQAYKIGC